MEILSLKNITKENFWVEEDLQNVFKLLIYKAKKY
jgi:hypothetical protein